MVILMWIMLRTNASGDAMQEIPLRVVSSIALLGRNDSDKILRDPLS